MPIELLEAGTMHSAAIGWIGSRSIEEDASTDEIARIDASVNELPSALLYFRNFTILERELFLAQRNHVVWARTSRVDDPTEFLAPRQFARLEEHRAIRAQMRALRADGVHQDKWRMLLPLCAQTSWTARMSFRDLVRMVSHLLDVLTYVQEENLPLSEYLSDQAAELMAMGTRAFNVPPEVVHECLKTFKAPTLVGPPAAAPVRQTVGAFTTMFMEMPIALRAQLIRHREIMVADSFVRSLKAPGSEQTNIGQPIVVQATALTAVWQAVLGKRTCWMAQADLWATIAQTFGSATSGLPCASGHCPYAQDAEQRLAGNDPGAPCPRYSNLYAKPLNDGQWEAAMREATDKPNKSMWRAELGITQDSLACTHAQGCPFPAICKADGHCDASGNGYR